MRNRILRTIPAGRLGYLVAAVLTSFSAFGSTLQVCEGTQGRVMVRVTFSNRLDLSQPLPRADYNLSYIQSGGFPFTLERTGKAIAWTKTDHLAVISMKSEGVDEQASIVLRPDSNQGTLTYQDFLTQPTNAGDPAVLRAIEVSCR